MFSFRSRALVSAAAFFVSIGLTAAVVFLPEHPDEKVVADLHRDPAAFAVGCSMIGAAAAIIVFVGLSLAALLARRWPARSDGNVQQLYSPNQAFFASVFGGPLAAISLFRANYLTLQNPAAARKTSIIGWTLFLTFMAVLFTLIYRGFALKGFGTGIGVGYSVAAKSLMASLQRTKEAIAKSDHYSFRSNWRVAGAAILYLAATLFIFFLTAFTLAVAGYHLPA